MTNQCFSLLVDFEQIIQSNNRRDLVGSIADVLLVYVHSHHKELHDDDTEDDPNGSGAITRSSSTVADSLTEHIDMIATFIQKGNSPQTAEMYLDKLSCYQQRKLEAEEKALFSNITNKPSSSQTPLSRKRKSDNITNSVTTATTKYNTRKAILSIQPILTEIQANLQSNRLRYAITLVQKVDSKRHLEDSDKNLAWYILLDHLYQNNMLLNEDCNSDFHLLSVNSRNSVDYISTYYLTDKI